MLEKFEFSNEFINFKMYLVMLYNLIWNALPGFALHFMFLKNHSFDYFKLNISIPVL